MFKFLFFFLFHIYLSTSITSCTTQDLHCMKEITVIKSWFSSCNHFLMINYWSQLYFVFVESIIDKMFMKNWSFKLQTHCNPTKQCYFIFTVFLATTLHRKWFSYFCWEVQFRFWTGCESNSTFWQVDLLYSLNCALYIMLTLKWRAIFLICDKKQ